jgi:hypothetical protein
LSKPEGGSYLDGVIAGIRSNGFWWRDEERKAILLSFAYRILSLTASSTPTSK